LTRSTHSWHISAVLICSLSEPIWDCI